MLSRVSPVLKTLLHDLKCYIKTIHTSFRELNIKCNLSKYRVKRITVSFSDEILLERSKLVLDGKDFFFRWYVRKDKWIGVGSKLFEIFTIYTLFLY